MRHRGLLREIQDHEPASFHKIPIMAMLNSECYCDCHEQNHQGSATLDSAQHTQVSTQIQAFLKLHIIASNDEEVEC